jgi:threonine/homoserine/homoserine lactone efflux protein
MPHIDWAPFFAFFLSTTLSPGPNNMASAANGLQHGYKKTMPFLLGIISGFFIAMLAIGLISTAILRYDPAIPALFKADWRLLYPLAGLPRNAGKLPDRAEGQPSL